MLLSAKENEAVLKALEAVLNSEFKKEVVLKLENYMGGELTVNPPTNEKEYQQKIKDPMVKIFNQVKAKIEKVFGKPITNKVYEPLTDTLYLGVALYGRYGNVYFSSGVPDNGTINANTYENSPLQGNTISGYQTSDGAYTAFNANTLPSQMKVLLNLDPNAVESSVGFFALSYKRDVWRACRKLINDYTGIVGGVLVIGLYNVQKCK
uniref:Uncharacterized protein n=1 Tax=viral metagenome TaxID=1070528 RepID=A0A6C0LDC4_9ZZZZ